MILSAFIPDMATRLGELMKSEVTKLLGITGDAKKLQRRLEMVTEFLEDAEKKKTQNDEIKNWLKELRETIYEADNIIDQCWIEAEKHKTKEQQASAILHKFHSWIIVIFGKSLRSTNLKCSTMAVLILVLRRCFCTKDTYFL